MPQCVPRRPLYPGPVGDGAASDVSAPSAESSDGRPEATKLEQMLAALTAKHEAEVAAEAEAEREALYDEGLYAV